MKKLQVIAGGTSGMGLATAIALGEYGPVLVGGRNEKRLENALATLKVHQGQYHALWAQGLPDFLRCAGCV